MSESTKYPTGPSPATLLNLLKLEDSLGASLSGSEGIDHFLYEKYLGDEAGGDWKLKAYYFVRPIIPRKIQLLLRSGYREKQVLRTFPAWPIEPTIVNTVRESLRAATRNGEVYRMSVWPEAKKFSFVITHDVEWDAGLRIAPSLSEIEQRHGFTSSFNIVPERYPIDWSIVEKLRAAGHEIGVHGLKHDGKLFQSYGIFKKRLVKIHQYAKEWGAVGFRSPSTLRSLEWMPELKFEYDSSFFDTDPYEPQPGGCCSIWPYFIGDLLELPMTMPQDHTVFEILGHKDVSLWKQKADWIIEHGGMILINVHPDYMNEERLKLYEEFLVYLKGKQGMWHAQPRDITRWWKDRTQSTLVRKNDTVSIQGPASGRARLLKTKVEGGILVDVPYMTTHQERPN